jgi:hypothetical protein
MSSLTVPFVTGKIKKTERITKKTLQKGFQLNLVSPFLITFLSASLKRLSDDGQQGKQK